MRIKTDYLILLEDRTLIFAYDRVTQQFLFKFMEVWDGDDNYIPEFDEHDFQRVTYNIDEYIPANDLKWCPEERAIKFTHATKDYRVHLGERCKFHTVFLNEIPDRYQIYTETLKLQILSQRISPIL